MKYLMKLSNEYEIEADSEVDAMEELVDYLARNNMTAENEFYDSIEVSLVDVEDDEIICHQCGFRCCQCPGGRT